MMAMSSFLKPTINSIAPLFPCNSSNCNGRVTVIRKHPNEVRFIARSSDDASSSSETATETWQGGNNGEDSSSAVEVAKGPPSLISALNVEKAFRGIAITDADHYGRLGLRRGCSYDLVKTAFENKINELSSQGLDDDKRTKELDLLKESYAILSNVEERRLYDWSLARTNAPERYTWPFEGDITQVAIKGTPPAQEPEDVGPTVAVGYFLLGWLILSFAMSIFLNQQ